MDQLFSLRHVSGATKILVLAPRSMSSGRFPEKKRAEFRSGSSNLTWRDVRLTGVSGKSVAAFRPLLERQAKEFRFSGSDKLQHATLPVYITVGNEPPMSLIHSLSVRLYRMAR